MAVTSEQREREGEAPTPRSGVEGALPAPKIAHKPVLVKELLDLLEPKPDGIYVDGTLGNAGHALAFLEAAKPKGFLFGFDRDPEILGLAKERLKIFENRVRIFQANFVQMGEFLKQEGCEEVDGIYLDLGVSSLQLDQADRGFSFSKAGAIDMRMDSSRGETVWEKIRQSNEMELTRVLKEYGEERCAAKIARALLKKMEEGKLNTTLDITQAAFQAYPPASRYRGIHPATRTFQALRIWVNEELDCLEKFLEEAPCLLKKNGRLAIISYHSLEDRIVKHRFRELSTPPPVSGLKARFAGETGGGAKGFKVLTKKPVRPSEEEIRENPRARSAKLRALIRLH